MSLNKKINKALIPLDTSSQEVNNISNLNSSSGNKRLKGFTLLEILLVIGIISIIAGITIIAINPARQLAQVRNTERKSDIKQIYNALNQYYIDNGHYPNTLLTSLTEICNTGNATSTHSIDCTNLVDLSSLVPTYLTAIPTDPKATSTGTGYKIIKYNSTKIIVTAPLSELNALTNIGTVDAYSVTFNANGGSGTMSDQSFNIDQTANLSANSFTRSGYTFAGWANTASGEVVYNDQDSYTMGAENTILYAKWTKLWACGDPFIDTRDSQEYATVLIGNQCWMQENLNVGTMITGTTTMTNNGILEKYCYDNSESNCTTDGGLYLWNETLNYSAYCNGTGASQPACTTPVQGICPTGWHIPSHYEFVTLEQFTCNSLLNSNCATKFPYDMTALSWLGTNEGTALKNTSGLFRALLAGYRHGMGFFGSRLSDGILWSSSKKNAWETSSGWMRVLQSSRPTIFRGEAVSDVGYSVRCLKN